MNLPAPDREWLLSALLGTVAVVIAVVIWPTHVEPVINLQIVKNQVPIEQLRQRRSVEQRKTVHVDRLELASGGQFAHPKLGAIGFANHFFVDIDKRFEVREAGDYRFVVGSDDGFALYIDDAELCSHTGARAMATQICVVSLEGGERRFRLRYFQADGPAGLSVQYGKQGESTLHWFGESTSRFVFEP